MAKLPILLYPDPRLHTVAAKVDRVDEKIRNLIKDMSDTMYAAPGVGLAATQVDQHLRIIVIDISPTHDELRTFINPELLESSGEADCEEGCLSVPGIYEKVTRAQRIRVKAQYLDAVRDWARRGAASPHVLDESRITSRLPRPHDEIAEAHARFRLGLHLLREGRADEAEQQMAAAIGLHPDSWAMWRQAAAKNERGLAAGPEFWARVDALGARPYYPPADITAAP